MQKINLTAEKSDIVFVDDVDVAKGVYAIHDLDSSIGLLVLSEGFYIKWFNNSDSPMECSFNGILERWSNMMKFYTIPDNRRITTEKELRIEDLKNTDIIGVVTASNNKGESVEIDYVFRFVINAANDSYCNMTAGLNSKGIVELFDSSNVITEAYRFPTRHDLYKWLSE